MKYTISILLALLIGTGCATETLVAPADDAGRAPGEDVQFSLSSPGPYNFNTTPGNTTAAAALTGTHAVQCADTGEGAASFTLTLSEKQLGQITDVVLNGGAAYVEVQTRIRYTGEGDYAYTEHIEVRFNGSTLYARGWGDGRSNPGRPTKESYNHLFYTILPSELDSLQAGGTYEVVATGHVSADLGSLCGEIVGGQVMWKAIMARVLLDP